MLNNADINSITYRFRPERLRLARELRALKKSELAEKVGKTPAAIGQFELGKTRPDVETTLTLALALGVPPRFFAHDSGTGSHIGIEECHFRSLRSASQRDRRQLLALGSMLSDLVAVLESYVSIPEVNVPEWNRTPETFADIEACAKFARTSLGLGLGPIGDMVELVESSGIVVCPLTHESERVDAFSYWYRKRPYVFLILSKESTSRSRFDVAHELGHLIMHPDVSPGNPRLESQANRFASAFLLPKESFYAECPTRLNMEHFFELKKRWRVSVAAMLRRARDLGRLSEASYRRGCIYLNQKDYRIAEPYEPEREWPSLINKALDIVMTEQSIEHIALRAGIPEPDMRQMLELLQTGSIQAHIPMPQSNLTVLPKAETRRGESRKIHDNADQNKP